MTMAAIVFVYVSEYAVTDADALTDSRYVPVVDQPKEEKLEGGELLVIRRAHGRGGFGLAAGPRLPCTLMAWTAT